MTSNQITDRITDQSATNTSGAIQVRSSSVRRKPPANFVVAALLCLVILATVFPFYWMVTASLKSRSDVLAFPPLFVFTPTLEHYT